MRVAIIGCGKLGLPLAVSIGQYHSVLGYDLNPEKMRKRPYEHHETGPDGKEGFQKYFDKADLDFLPLNECIEKADLILVIVQTPHEPDFEGITRLNHRRADFDYSFLKEACKQVSFFRKPGQPVAIVSTVLPGTTRREVLPLLPGLVYSPAFPAMGTVMRDFLDPEFVLLGGDDLVAVRSFEEFYRSLGIKAPVFKVSIESAELTKVAYNNFVSFKLAYANTLLEIAHKTKHCNVDEVTDVLKSAKRRLLSPAYLTAGVGDGGACLVAGTMIALEGQPKAIEFVVPGDKVLTRKGYSKVLRAWESKRVREVESVLFSSGSIITGTPDHRVWTDNRGWVPLGKVATQDTCLCCYETAMSWDGKAPITWPILHVPRSFPEEVPVYDLEVEAGEFFANGVLVHNCHPRDNIAMSWLAEELNLSGNLFDTVMYTREWQAEWLINLFVSCAGGLPLVLLGRAYKPESNIITGSVAVLMANLLKERNLPFEQYDPLTDPPRSVIGDGPKAYLIATKHQCFKNYEFPEGSVVVDPHRYIPARKGVKLVPVGVGR